MTSTQQFIEDAIKGGYAKAHQMIHASGQTVARPIEITLLDPLAWKAVGETRIETWKVIKMIDHRRGHEQSINSWLYYWHRFIDHLADGKTIEEALSLIA